MEHKFQLFREIKWREKKNSRVTRKLRWVENCTKKNRKKNDDEMSLRPLAMCCCNHTTDRDRKKRKFSSTSSSLFSLLLTLAISWKWKLELRNSYKTRRTMRHDWVLALSIFLITLTILSVSSSISISLSRDLSALIRNPTLIHLYSPLMSVHMNFLFASSFFSFIFFYLFFSCC